MLELDTSSRWIGSALSDRLSDSVRAKIDICNSLDHSGCQDSVLKHCRSLTTADRWPGCWGSIALPRCSWGILQPQPTGGLVVGGVSFFRGAVVVFYGPSRQVASLLGEYRSSEVQLGYSTAPADRADNKNEKILRILCDSRFKLHVT